MFVTDMSHYLHQKSNEYILFDLCSVKCNLISAL